MAVNNTITLLALYFLDGRGDDDFTEDYAQVYRGQKVTWYEIPDHCPSAEESIAWVQTTKLRSWDDNPARTRRIAYYKYLARGRLLIIMLGYAWFQEVST